jgi:hypothetical protein
MNVPITHVLITHHRLKFPSGRWINLAITNSHSDHRRAFRVLFKTSWRIQPFMCPMKPTGKARRAGCVEKSTPDDLASRITSSPIHRDSKLAMHLREEKSLGSLNRGPVTLQASWKEAKREAPDVSWTKAVNKGMLELDGDLHIETYMTTSKE